jgi:ring-1,2-phenylacetyl-CoA epoxidase subunit PaaE
MPKFHPLTVQDIRRETADCVSVAFDLPAELAQDYQFTQGQYLTLKAEINGEEVRRSYSICVSPDDEDLRVAIKKVPGGRFSTFANEVLQAGDTLEVMTPMGNFFTELNPANEKHYVAFAAGSGITPIMSIMKAVLQQEPNSQFTLFYGNRGVDSIIFHEQIEALKSNYLNRLSVHHLLSREHPGVDLFYGRIDADKCNSIFNLLIDPKDVDEFFICGPEPMIHAVRDTLVDQLKVPSKQVHVELFTSPVAPLVPQQETEEEEAVDQSATSTVQVTVDGEMTTFELNPGGKTILDAASEAGSDVPFSCKGGVCSTCKAKVMEGKVKMDINYALEEDEVAAGYILTCQAHPRSERVVISFDE